MFFKIFVFAVVLVALVYASPVPEPGYAAAGLGYGARSFGFGGFGARTIGFGGYNGGYAGYGGYGRGFGFYG
ncbi:hypothetical protein TSAR_002730 [Trichomalopsis sarcophagae]|uniref:Uncharacterized protein n=1 Tax=Trichomalopsis sarcophagae TaxID=543379 RepID=A0A232F8A9_9HYME|nr:hypothetical protein TSAR_002730 [Trichomalopsis sarcophagae]